MNPLTVSCSGRWVYTLTQDEQEVLAAHIAGDTPAQAEAYLLKTEGITRAFVTRTLPQDPLHIKFVILIGV